MPKNAAGVYTLPPGINPVVPGTVIMDTWANPTLSDMAQAITDSLDRYGRGGMLAAFKIASGTVALPGLAFTDEPSTGIYRIGAGEMGISVLGQKKATFSATGLALNAVALSGISDLTTDGNTILGDAVGDTLNVAGGSLQVSAAGYVGVGAAPTEGAGSTRVQVGSAAHATSGLLVSSTTSALTMYASSTAGAYLAWKGGTPLILGEAPNDLSAFTERMRIDASGNVGIGATPSGYKLDFGITGAGTIGGVANIGGFSDSGAYSIYAGRSSLNGGFIQLYGGSHVSPNQVIIGTAGTERMRIAANGNVGIDRDPAYKFDSRCDITGAKQFRFGGAGLGSLYGYADGGGAGITNSDPFTAGSLVYMDGTAFHVYCNGNERYKIATDGVHTFTSGGYHSDLRLTGTTEPNRYGARILGDVGGGQQSLVFQINQNNSGYFTALQITGAGALLDGAGLELGYRDVPRVTGGFERGKCYAISAGVTLDAAATGYTYSIYNDSAAAVTLTQGGSVTVRLAGTTSTGNRTLAARGLATLWFNAANECIISGAGVS